MKIAIFAFQGISMFHLSVPISIFQDAFAGSNSHFEVEVCSYSAGEIKTSNGTALNVECGIEQLASADVLIFPSWDTNKLPSKQLIDIVTQAYNDKKIIVGLCLGAYVLAHARLLDDKEATTHWAFGDDFCARFPKVKYCADPLYIQQDNLLTSAGTAAALDCCLFLLKNLSNCEIANHIARMMVSAPQRSGGQKQYISQPILTTASDMRINKLVEKVLHDPAKAVSLEQAVTFCAMSQRSFSRHFKRHFSMSFSQWLLSVRLKLAQDMLLQSKLSIAQIALDCGFSGEQNLRKQFHKSFSTSPSKWREMFATENPK